MKFNALAIALVTASLGFSTLTLAQDHYRHNGPNNAPGMLYRVGPQDVVRVDQRAERREDRREERMADRCEERREDRRDDHRHDRQHDRWDTKGDHRPDYRGYHARPDPGYYQGARPGYYHPNYYNARGPQFRRGGYLPREFRNRQYQVVDYYTYRLSAPPRDHQWVQVGADYVLIAIATGLIASIVLSN